MLSIWLRRRRDEGTPQAHPLRDTEQRLAPARWHGQYHVVFGPKRRQNARLGHMRKALGSIFPALAGRSHFVFDSVNLLYYDVSRLSRGYAAAA
jgi:hypothetical protein